MPRRRRNRLRDLFPDLSPEQIGQAQLANDSSAQIELPDEGTNQVPFSFGGLRDTLSQRVDRGGFKRDRLDRILSGAIGRKQSEFADLFGLETQSDDKRRFNVGMPQLRKLRASGQFFNPSQSAFIDRILQFQGRPPDGPGDPDDPDGPGGPDDPGGPDGPDGPGGPGGGVDPTERPPNQQIFPSEGDPRLDPNNFDPTLGASPGQGIQVGEDPLSQLISGALDQTISSGGAPQSAVAREANQSLIERLREFRESEPPDPTLPEVEPAPEAGPVEGQLNESLLGLLQSGGQFDEDIVNRRAESARENLERFRRSELDTLGSRLANRGLLGSGPERTGLERTSENIAGQFATTFRDIFTREAEAANQRFIQAAQLAEQTTGRRRQEALERARLEQQRAQELARLAQQQEQQHRQQELEALALSQQAAGRDQQALLTAVDLANQRQETLTNLALQQLDRNTAFNQFLAQFGLQREQVMNAIREGRIAALIPLLDRFFQGAQIGQRGTV